MHRLASGFHAQQTLLIGHIVSLHQPAVFAIHLTLLQLPAHPAQVDVRHERESVRSSRAPQNSGRDYPARIYVDVGRTEPVGSRDIIPRSDIGFMVRFISIGILRASLPAYVFRHIGVHEVTFHTQRQGGERCDLQDIR